MLFMDTHPREWDESWFAMSHVDLSPLQTNLGSPKMGFHWARNCLQALVDNRKWPREEHAGLLLAVQFLGAEPLNDISRLWAVSEVCRPVAAETPVGRVMASDPE